MGTMKPAGLLPASPTHSGNIPVRVLVQRLRPIAKTNQQMTLKLAGQVIGSPIRNITDKLERYQTITSIKTNINKPYGVQRPHQEDDVRSSNLVINSETEKFCPIRIAL